MLDVSIHLEVDELLVGRDKLVAGVCVDHGQLLNLVKVLLQGESVGHRMGVFFPTVMLMERRMQLELTGLVIQSEALGDHVGFL